LHLNYVAKNLKKIEHGEIVICSAQ